MAVRSIGRLSPFGRAGVRVFRHFLRLAKMPRSNWGAVQLSTLDRRQRKRNQYYQPVVTSQLSSVLGPVWGLTCFHPSSRAMPRSHEVAKLAGQTKE
ncbi:hypothetical protein GW17_00038178 [Ensete ventricosum]|nr:hypothetical protein GW17_00038178 [Ensete ventricosum]